MDFTSFVSNPETYVRLIMGVLREIVPGIHTWSEYSDEKQLNFNGYFLVHQGEAVIIDPPALSPEGLSELEHLIAANAGSPLKAILLTNVHHDRNSQSLKETFPVPVLLNENDKPLLEFEPDGTFKDGETLFCGIRVIQFDDQKSPGESAFLIEDRRVLVVGDALIGKVPGKINLLPPDKYEDISRAKQGLKILKDCDFDVLLPGDGEPILKGAKKVVLEFLEN